jgi:putative copper resistance protein D
MAGDGLAPLMLALKLALYAAALLSAGLALHGALGVVERSERATWIRLSALAAALALALGALKLLLLNAQLAGGLAHALDAESFGWTWAMQAPSLIALATGAAAALAAWVSQRHWFGVIAVLGFSASFALAGHTQALAAPGLAPWIVGLHVLIASYWIAAPISLWPRDTLADEALQRRLERFSAGAIVAIPLLFVAGLWLAWRISGGLAPLLESGYGRLLLAKLAAASVALGLGALNKQFVTAMIIRTPERGRMWLKRTLAADTLLFLTALLLIGWATTLTGPPDL